MQQEEVLMDDILDDSEYLDEDIDELCDVERLDNI